MKIVDNVWTGIWLGMGFAIGMYSFGFITNMLLSLVNLFFALLKLRHGLV